jgi:endo-1,4-beta-mannosidase
LAGLHAQAGRIDETMTARFADFLDAHSDVAVITVPTFLVGDMSRENCDTPWQGDRGLYRDVWMLARRARFADEMVARFHAHLAVCGWLVSNEMPIYRGQAAREVIASCARIIRYAVRAVGGTQPFSPGGGAWGIELATVVLPEVLEWLTGGLRLAWLDGTAGGGITLGPSAS